MGQFSWLDCASPNAQILSGVYKDSYVLVPQEFRDKYGMTIKEDCYDGYGHFGGYDIFNLIAEWNKYDIPKIFDSYPDDNWNKQHLSDIAKMYAEDVPETVIDDYANRKFEAGENEEINYKYLKNGDWKRGLGIGIAAYDKQNASLKYPIKISYTPNLIYENCKPSLNDVDQGWFNYGKAIRPDVVTFIQYDWNKYKAALDEFSTDDLNMVDCDDLLKWIEKDHDFCQDMLNHLPERTLQLIEEHMGSTYGNPVIDIEAEKGPWSAFHIVWYPGQRNNLPEAVELPMDMWDTLGDPLISSQFKGERVRDYLVSTFGARPQSFTVANGQFNYALRSNGPDNDKPVETGLLYNVCEVGKNLVVEDNVQEALGLQY